MARLSHQHDWRLASVKRWSDRNRAVEHQRCGTCPKRWTLKVPVVPRKRA